jgi:uncharacterized protein DUF882
MRPARSSKPRLAGIVAKWCFPCAVLAALIVALTVAGPDRALQAQGATPAEVAQVDVLQSVGMPVQAQVASADLLGLSGRLRVVMETPDALLLNPLLKPLLAGAPPDRAATTSWPKLTTPDGAPFTVVPLVPFETAKDSDFAAYRVGMWPAMPTPNPRYTPPSGFIGVTAENKGTSVSAHFKFQDFLTHDQGNVWPKVLVLRPALLDKLELLSQELEREGLSGELHVMSGFRTPQYNAQGVGKGGRATHSRHMYGDAADVFVDADGNGMMDDLNKDGRITVADARVLRSAAEKVEAQYPSLVGGLAAYPANTAHGPFVHVDARGVKARW